MTDLTDLERLKAIAKAMKDCHQELEMAGLIKQFHHETGRLPLPPDIQKVMPPGWGAHGVPDEVNAFYRRPVVMDMKTLLVKQDQVNAHDSLVYDTRLPRPAPPKKEPE